MDSEPDDNPLEGMEKVAAHRALGLLDLGFTLPQVLLLVGRPDIVRHAQVLIDAGCPPDVAFDILY